MCVNIGAPSNQPFFGHALSEVYNSRVRLLLRYQKYPVPELLNIAKDPKYPGDRNALLQKVVALASAPEHEDTRSLLEVASKIEFQNKNELLGKVVQMATAGDDNSILDIETLLKVAKFPFYPFKDKLMEMIVQHVCRYRQDNASILMEIADQVDSKTSLRILNRVIGVATREGYEDAHVLLKVADHPDFPNKNHLLKVSVVVVVLFCALYLITCWMEDLFLTLSFCCMMIVL